MGHIIFMLGFEPGAIDVTAAGWAEMYVLD